MQNKHTKLNAKQLLGFPLTLLFFLFLCVFTLADFLGADQQTSELENRPLIQSPPFTLQAFLGNEWTKAFGEYTRDQFILRDDWISLHSMLEQGQGKLEIGGVWLARDGYQIAKNDIWSSVQDQALALNTKAVCELAQRHPGKVNVMVAPSPADTLRGKLRANPPQIDETAKLNSMNASFAAAGANVIDLRPSFAKANTLGTQLFYRTDHHWTTDGGAQIAYRQFCEANGLTPVLPPQAQEVQVPDFYGTNFAKSKKFGTISDTLLYYNFPENLEVFSYNADGTLNSENGPIMLAEKLESFDKYGAFLRGNNGYSELTGTGEGSILLIKDSYGNSFAPYLLQNYAKVGIIDLRAWFSVDSTMAEGNFDELLVLYSFNSFTTDMYARRMLTEMQQ